MIASRYIASTSSKMLPYEDFEAINVLKWNNSKWKALCPYFLKTDGKEENANPGNVLFENFYQSIKIYDVVYENSVYASRFHTGNPKYQWWKFEPVNPEGDVIISNDVINLDVYFPWRNSLWNCPNPIRCPNKFHRKSKVLFSLLINEKGEQTRMNYITARKRIYAQEYIRLVKKLPQYAALLEKLSKGNIMIGEIDVPAKHKKGIYGQNCDHQNICILDLKLLEQLLEDESEPFGHGLCLAYSLLSDLQ